jgi:hypothetical protein
MTIKRKCSTCYYDSLGFGDDGWKKCYKLIGRCSSMDGLQGWKPIEEPVELDTERYTTQTMVMPETKRYMDFGIEEDTP